MAVDDALMEPPTEPEPVRIGQSKYLPDYCMMVINLGQQGNSKAQMAKALGVDRSTLKVWERTHAPFRDAMKYAVDLAQAWWEDEAQRNLGNPKFNTALWAKTMAARFPADYREKFQALGPGDGPLQAKHEVRVEFVKPKP